MERYINSYATENDIQIALQNGELLKPYVAYIEDVDRIDWNSKEIVDYTTEYLTFNILSAGTINWTASKTSIAKTIDYKLNGGEWVSITSNTGSSAPTITVNSGDKIQFRGSNAQYAIDYYSNYNSFGGSASFEAEGNIMSLIYGDDFKNNSTISSTYAFASLFRDCTKLVSAENLVLPTTTLVDCCYFYMFYNCASLTTAPKELPATTLANSCYAYMFDSCKSLTTAPVLPATTLASSCYDNMFRNCSSLTTAPALPATTLANSCYIYMFYNCASLTSAPALPATTLATYCYRYMFGGCSSLTTAPELPATTLASSCYDGMFSNTNVLPDCSNIDFASSTVVARGGLKGLFSGTKVTDNDLERLLPKNDNGRYYLPATTLASSCYGGMFDSCTSLVNAPELPATTLADSCYYNMFYGCSSLTTAPELPATTLADGCYSAMFTGCRSLTTAPELPATTLASSCYDNMFRNCSSLTTAPALPATTLADGCYSAMFNGCRSLTTAPELPATTLAQNCYSYMFGDCASLNYIKCLATDISASDCTSNWVINVPSTGTFVKNPKMTSWGTGDSGIPNGWTVQDA